MKQIREEVYDLSLRLGNTKEIYQSVEVLRSNVL